MLETEKKNLDKKIAHSFKLLFCFLKTLDRKIVILVMIRNREIFKAYLIFHTNWGPLKSHCLRKRLKVFHIYFYQLIKV